MARVRIVSGSVIAGAAVALTTVGVAGAGGVAPSVLVGGKGVVARNDGVRYVAVHAGGRTVVEKIRLADGRVLRWRSFQGSYGIPLVAYDGSVGGLSRDGRTLVLARPLASAAGVGRFAIVDTRTLRLRTVVRLGGAWAFDALSPNGSTMYLIQYLNADPSALRYRVRAYDLRAGRLDPRVIVDKREPDEKMTGQPVTRVEGRDGGWAYTLYSRQDEAPFLHALDTTHRLAVCVDLPQRLAANAFRVRMALSPDATKLVLRLNGARAAVVDTRTFAVRSG
jgi:hypothetical protein